MKTKDKVIELLTKHTHLQDSDNKLICTYWFNELLKKQIDPHKISSFEFMQMYAKSQLTNTESIRRMRQKVQEENKHLRGKLYKGKQTTKQDEWKAELGYGKKEY